MLKRSYIWVAILIVTTLGCGIPNITESRKNLPPWEKLPPGNDITYLEKFTRDSGVDPLYLAKIKYDDDAALQRVIDTFGLVPHTGTEPPESFAEILKNPPPWFPMGSVTHIYIYPDDGQEYVSTLWVDAEAKVAILERSWW